MNLVDSFKPVFFIKYIDVGYGVTVNIIKFVCSAIDFVLVELFGVVIGAYITL